MTNFVTRIDPKVLAAALQEIEGRGFDLSTESGRKDAQVVVQRLLASDESEARLVDAIVRLEDGLQSGQKHEIERKVAGTSIKQASIRDSWVAAQGSSSSLVPPMGSPEFDQYVDAAGAHESMTLQEKSAVTPRESWLLYYHYRDFDRILRNAENRLQAYALKDRRSFVDRLSAAFDGFVNSGKREDSTSVTHYPGRFVVEVKLHSDAARWVSSLLEDGLLVRLQSSGDKPVEIMLRIGSDAAQENELLRAFESKPGLGVKLIHTARRALLEEAGAARPESLRP